jgi:hypothetical protein
MWDLDVDVSSRPFIISDRLEVREAQRGLTLTFDTASDGSQVHRRGRKQLFPLGRLDPRLLSKHHLLLDCS